MYRKSTAPAAKQHKPIDRAFEQAPGGSPHHATTRQPTFALPRFGILRCDFVGCQCNFEWIDREKPPKPHFSLGNFIAAESLDTHSMSHTDYF